MPANTDAFVKCPVCNVLVKRLTRHLAKVHGPKKNEPKKIAGSLSPYQPGTIPRRCACGRPPIPGSNVCYNCGG